MNGANNKHNNNIQINQKTDTLNRYLDNVINYNTARKSDSDSSHSSDHQLNSNNLHGKVPSHPYHQQLFHHRQVTPSLIWEGQGCWSGAFLIKN